jgi:hypothetical protein
MGFKLHGTKMVALLHVAFWAIILGLPFYFFYRLDIPVEFAWVYYINIIINGIIFYSNYLVLIPRFFFNNRKLKYYAFALLLTGFLFVVAMISSNFVFDKFRGDSPELFHRDRTERSDEPLPATGKRRFFRLPFGPMSVYNFTFNAFVFTVFAIGLRLLERHALIEKRQKELEKEKLNSELAFLKNQISPHFFFNTLNNIYSLIGINTADSQEAVLKLSKMMRYLLYDSEQGETKLNNEIDFMINYIDLMRLRISDKVKLNVSFPEQYENVSIPPLLFISVIENAFKHGVSYREKSFIDIVMEVSKEMIVFRCSNSLITKLDSDVDNRYGIGLENLRKRLSLIFPGRHELLISEDNAFKVVVKILLTQQSDDQHYRH